MALREGTKALAAIAISLLAAALTAELFAAGTGKKPDGNDDAPQKPSMAAVNEGFSILPSLKGSKTEKDYRAKLAAVIDRTFIVPFKEANKSSPALVEKGKALMESCVKSMCATPDATPDAKLGRDAKEMLLKDKSDDPYLNIWLGYALMKSGNYASASRRINGALGKIKDLPNRQAIEAFARFHISQCLYMEKKLDSDEDKANNAAFLKAIASSLESCSLTKDDGQVALRLLLQWAVLKKHERGWKNIWFEFKDRKGIDSWLMKTIEGNTESELAWDARGNGWAETVTKEGWHGFALHLGKACKLLTDAWRERPDLPEAPAKMIRVAMGGHANPGDTTELWLQRTVQAQFDYLPAYSQFCLANRPRWNGEYPTILALGLDSLNTARFDTLVPEFYLSSLNVVGNDMDSNRWRRPYRMPGTEQNLERLFSELLKAEGLSTDEKDGLNLEWAFCLAWSGAYEKADEKLRKLPKNISISKDLKKRGLDPEKIARKDLETQIRMFASPAKELFLKWDKSLLFGMPEDAKRTVKDLLPSIKDDADAKTYVLNNTAFMLTGEETDDLKNWNEPLLCIAISGSKEAMSFLLDNGVDPNYSDDKGCTPLAYAAWKGNLELAKLLVRKGAKLDFVGKTGDVALAYCAAYGSPEGVAFLVENGASINFKAQDSEGLTPLMYAAREGKPEALKALLDKGADPKLSDKNGLSALHYAARSGKAEMLSELLKKGASRDAKDKSGKTPLDYAKDSGSKACVETLSK